MGRVNTWLHMDDYLGVHTINYSISNVQYARLHEMELPKFASKKIVFELRSILRRDLVLVFAPVVGSYRSCRTVCESALEFICLSVDYKNEKAIQKTSRFV